MTSDKASKEARCDELDKQLADMRNEMAALEAASNTRFAFDLRRIYRQRPAWAINVEWAEFVKRELALRAVLATGNPNG